MVVILRSGEVRKDEILDMCFWQCQSPVAFVDDEATNLRELEAIVEHTKLQKWRAQSMLAWYAKNRSGHEPRRRHVT